MAFVENQGVKIYWDEQGQGEPVLLIMGLAYPSQMWYRTGLFWCRATGPWSSTTVASGVVIFHRDRIPSR
jgi:hypothetical protein